MNSTIHAKHAKHADLKVKKSFVNLSSASASALEVQARCDLFSEVIQVIQKENLCKFHDKNEEEVRHAITIWLAFVVQALKEIAQQHPMLNMARYYICRFEGPFSNDKVESLTFTKWQIYSVEALMNANFVLPLALLNNDHESSKELIVRLGNYLREVIKDKTISPNSYPSRTLSGVLAICI